MNKTEDPTDQNIYISKPWVYPELLLISHAFHTDILELLVLSKDYSWVSGVTQRFRLRGLVLYRQVVKQAEPKNLLRTTKFDQKQQFLSVFCALAS